MEICEIYSHFNGKSLLQQQDDIWMNILKTFNNPNLVFEKGEPRRIKMKISEDMNDFGWADNVVIHPSHLTINFLKDKVGICFQLGNVARIYADLLKMKLLYDQDIITIGVLIVPVKEASKQLGHNHVYYERLIEEMKIFSNIIHMPISVIGLE
jgi:hypothetical protein